MFRNVPGSIDARYRIIRVSKSPPEKIQHPENNARQSTKGIHQRSISLVRNKKPLNVRQTAMIRFARFFFNWRPRMKKTPLLDFSTKILSLITTEAITCSRLVFCLSLP